MAKESLTPGYLVDAMRRQKPKRKRVEVLERMGDVLDGNCSPLQRDMVLEAMIEFGTRTHFFVRSSEAEGITEGIKRRRPRFSYEFIESEELIDKSVEFKNQPVMKMRSLPQRSHHKMTFWPKP